MTKEPEEKKDRNHTSKYASLPQYFSLKPTFPRNNNRLSINRADDDDDDSLDEEWKITESMKSALKHSDWLRMELKDGGLRNLIKGIVTSSGGQKHLALKQVKERYPVFQSFLDKLLVLAGVLERQDGDEEESLEEFLERDWDEERPALSLLPILRRKMPVFEPVHHSSSESDENESSSEEGEESSSSTSTSSSSSSSSSSVGASDEEDS